MKSCVIFCGGSTQNRQRTIEYTNGVSMVICADGGYDNALECGIVPNVVIGDMDSVIRPISDGIKIIKYPKRKDKTDTQLCIEYAKQNGYEDITLVYASGGRIDHYLANIMLLDKNVKLFDGVSTIYKVGGEFSIPARVNDIVSIIPLTDVYITNIGMLYKQDNDIILMGDSKGISNVVTKDNPKIFVEGMCLVIVGEKYE